MLGRILNGKSQANNVSLGEKNTMYFNKELNSWVLPGEEEKLKEELAQMQAPPPVVEQNTLVNPKPLDPTKTENLYPVPRRVAPPLSKQSNISSDQSPVIPYKATEIRFDPRADVVDATDDKSTNFTDKQAPSNGFSPPITKTYRLNPSGDAESNPNAPSNSYNSMNRPRDLDRQAVTNSEVDQFDEPNSNPNGERPVSRSILSNDKSSSNQKYSKQDNDEHDALEPKSNTTILGGRFDQNVRRADTNEDQVSRNYYVESVSTSSLKYKNLMSSVSPHKSSEKLNTTTHNNNYYDRRTDTVTSPDDRASHTADLRPSFKLNDPTFSDRQSCFNEIGSNTVFSIPKKPDLLPSNPSTNYHKNDELSETSHRNNYSSKEQTNYGSSDNSRDATKSRSGKPVAKASDYSNIKEVTNSHIIPNINDFNDSYQQDNQSNDRYTAKTADNGVTRKSNQEQNEYNSSIPDASSVSRPSSAHKRNDLNNVPGVKSMLKSYGMYQNLNDSYSSRSGLSSASQTALRAARAALNSVYDMVNFDATALIENSCFINETNIHIIDELESLLNDKQNGSADLFEFDALKSKIRTITINPENTSKTWKNEIKSVLNNIVTVCEANLIKVQNESAKNINKVTTVLDAALQEICRLQDQLTLANENVEFLKQQLKHRDNILSALNNRIIDSIQINTKIS